MQIPTSLTASTLTEDPSHPSVCFAGMAKKPCTATNSIVPHCARPPIPAWLGALIGCTAGCQTTDWLLPTISGCVLSFHMTASGKNKYWLQYYPYVWKSVNLFDDMTVNAAKSTSMKYLTDLCFWSVQVVIWKLMWRSSYKWLIYFKHLFARNVLLKKKCRMFLTLWLSY